MFAIDRLIEKIDSMQNPTVAGLDPRLEYIPKEILDTAVEKYGETLDAGAEAIYNFNIGLIDALYDIVPAVKLQSACYEAFGPSGMNAMRETLIYAKSKGLFTISDAKRGDIGSTSQCYSSAFLGKTRVGNTLCEAFPSDALTVNPYLGADNLNEFLTDCKEYEKMIFLLVKTSNKSSADVQDLSSGGKTVYRIVAEQAERASQSLVGEYGYSSLAIVAGATYPEQIRELREAHPGLFFLVPGYGAQGAGAKEIAYAFDRNDRGAIVNNSRGIMCAWQKSGANFAAAAREAAVTMKNDLRP